MLDPSPSILHADEARAFGTLANVCAVVWKGECTPARNDAWIEATHDLARRLGTPIALVSILGLGSPSPPRAVRNTQSRFLEELSRTALAAGIVVDGAGVRAGMVRAIITSVSALTRYKCPFNVVAGDAEMARWLDERAASLPPGAPRAGERELGRFFTSLRAAVRVKSRS